MTFHGRGFLLLALADVVPVNGNLYSGLGFRSTQDSGLLYHRQFPVRPPAPFPPSRLPPSDLCPAIPESDRLLPHDLLEQQWGLQWLEGFSLGPWLGPLTWALSPGWALRGVPAAGPCDTPVYGD